MPFSSFDFETVLFHDEQTIAYSQKFYYDSEDENASNPQELLATFIKNEIIILAKCNFLDERKLLIAIPVE